ncbi:type II toxin-antitoxin system VapC family toxin [Ferrovibrio sp.]|uniref:type II toxin-antitoxin system VapC family toxin n=1 Tax=Ferrovibrio sp. TaxID=1917215 RepID=UPI0025C2BD60|nr:type II toxin-antitoxin system VapC family toxin [Ferrovibrio sp.]MBX3455969.1 type II toxin-antitoxin system VapC family toxin [Ferrovibrio sp.]
MIVDTSAVLAILLEESEGPAFKRLIAETPGDHAISPMNYLEAAVRVDRLPVRGKAEELDPLLDALDVKIAASTAQQAKLAREAYQRFGRGNHAAQLNLGDCFAYALSKARSEPLLFKGDDFRKTDVEAAL